MYNTNDQNRISKEDSRFLTEGELLELDGILLKTDEDIIRKAGEISEILRMKDDLVRKLRGAYLVAAASLKERDAALEDKGKALSEEVKAKWELKNRFDSLQQSYTELGTKYNELKIKQDNTSQQTQELKAALAGQGESYRTLEADSKRIQRECSQYYTDARADKERAEDALRQVQADLGEARLAADALQERLGKELKDREVREKELQELEDRLRAETDKAGILGKEVQQYRLREQKMPVVMRLYNAYSGMMDKRGELPEAFFERMQSVVPPDDFDSFLAGVLKPSFPISYYLSVQSFMTVCSRGGQVSGEAMKEALRVSDELLSAVFDFGSEYFREEKLVRINCKAGEPFRGSVCKYVDGKGGMYGNIVRVCLQGFRDEKNNQVYCSYVEGE